MARPGSAKAEEHLKEVDHIVYMLARIHISAQWQIMITKVYLLYYSY